MIHHVHSTLLTETNAPAAGQNSGASTGSSTLESFQGVLSDAVGPSRRAAREGEELNSGLAARDSIHSDNLIRRPAQTPTESASGSATSSETPGPPDGGYDPFLQAAYSNPFASLSNPATSPTTPVSANTATASASTVSTTTSATASATTADAQRAFDNAYWASQPAAVQALRTMPDSSQKTALAAQLATEGYSIDVPIMVWGWDPSIVTSMRQAEGYTWVPSALQNPVEMLPGLPAMGSITAYNPNNPPAGSIAV